MLETGLKSDKVQNKRTEGSIPTLTILHSLPGRVRLHFSKPLLHYDFMKQQLSRDKRIKHLEYSRPSQTCLILYEHEDISLLQVLKLLTISLADEYNLQPVFVRSEYMSRFTVLTQISGLAIILAAAGHILRAAPRTNAVLGWAAVGTTFAAVFEHAYKEVKQTGSFDPEALSIVFLVNSAGRGQFIRGALFTWLTSFSRHFLHVPFFEGLKLTVVEGIDPATQAKYQDVLASSSYSLSGLDTGRGVSV